MAEKAAAAKKPGKVKTAAKNAAGKVKTAAKNAGNKIKATAKKAGSKVAAKAKAYRADLDAAYDTGYHDGYNAAKKIPRVPGAREAATAGYHTGQRDSRRAEKIEKRLAKSRKGGRK